MQFDEKGAFVGKKEENCDPLDPVVKIDFRVIFGTVAAGLTDHVWPLSEWLAYPAVQRS